jgi:hypothetical protein
VVIGESVGVAPDFLGEHVNVLDASVRRSASEVVGEDLGPPPIDYAGELGQLGDLDVGAVLEEHDQPSAGVSDVVGGVHLAQKLLSDNRPSGWVLQPGS